VVRAVRRLGLALAFLAGGPGQALGASDLLLLPEAPRIRDIRIEGTHRLTAGELQKVVSIKTPDFFHPFRKPRFYRGLIQQEARTIEAHARAKGLAAATVVWDTLSVKNGVDLVFRVYEGSEYEVLDVDIRGVNAESEQQIRDRLILQRGKPWAVIDLEIDRARIDNDQANRGHPFARISTYSEVGHDSVLIIHRVDPGPLTTFDRFDLTGAEGLSGGSLRREVTFDPGDVFSRHEVERSRQRLFDTGYFRDVDVVYPPAGIDSVNNTVDVLFRLTQRKQKWISGGVGYTSDNLLRLTAEWGTRSIFGSGRELRLNARTAREIFGNAPFFHQRETLAQATLAERWLFGTRLRGQLQAYYQFDNLRNEFVKQDILGAGAEILYEIKERRSSVALIYDARGTTTDVEPDSLADEVCLDDPSFCRRRYITRSMAGRLTIDERDDFLNPKRGHRHELQLERAGGVFGGDSNFLKGVENSSYLFPGLFGATIGTRIRFGGIDPDSGLVPGSMGQDAVDDITSVPFEERFLTGGANSVRGYQENTLNGLADGKDPSGGGLLTLLANLEMRFPIRGPLGGAIFLDAGNVWREYSRVKIRHFVPTFDTEKTTPEHMRYSVGAGLRFNSPVGPIRLEWAYRLSPARHEFPSDLHLAVGQTF